MLNTTDETMDKVHTINLEMLNALDTICQKYNIKYFLFWGGLLGAIRHKGMIPWDNDIDICISRNDFKILYAHSNELPENIRLVLPETLGENKYFDSMPRLNYRDAYIKMDEEVCKFYENRNNRIDLDLFFVDKTYAGFKGKIQRYHLAVVYGLMNAYRYPEFDRNKSLSYRLCNKILTFIGKKIPLYKLREKSIKLATKYNNDPKANYYFASTGAMDSLLVKLIPQSYLSKINYVDFENTKVPIPSQSHEILQILYGNYMELPPEDKRIPHWGDVLINRENFIFEEPK